MFPLLRYFSIMSFVAIAGVTALFAFGGRQRALADLTELAESRNVALTQAFANSLWPQFAPFVDAASALSREELQAHPEIARLRQAVLAQMNGLEVVKVKVYDRAGLTVFSTEARQIGEDKSANAGFRSARSGQVASELTHRDTFSDFEGAVEDRDVFSSYLPIRHGPAGPVEGVFELYYDVTAFLQKAKRAQTITVLTVAFTLLLLYCVLFFVVRRADAIMKRQYRELESSGNQLRQAQKMEAVGHLAGGVAHNFNNLLTVMTGRLSLGLEALEPEHRARPQLERVRTAIERATHLTQQILAFGRKQVLRPSAIDLNEVIAGMHTLLSPLIGEDVELVVVSAAGLGLAKVDRAQMEQVLMNLAVNARDAMPGGGRLVITTANVALDGTRASALDAVGPGECVAVSVRDTGHGMDAATQARIFEPFFTTKEVGKGTGLGLATVHGIVSQSGGCVVVQSEIGRGTTFTIYLPRFRGAAPPAPAAPEAAPRGSGETILLVEDEEELRRVVQDVLGAYGYQVLAAQHAAEALELVGREAAAIDLLLTDVVMPGMSGPALAARLAGLWPGLRVLYMSGYADDAVLERGVETDAEAFLPKPFTNREIVRKVHEVLAASRLDRRP